MLIMLVFYTFFIYQIYGCAPVYRIPPRQMAPSMFVRVIIDAKSELEIKGKNISIKNHRIKGNYFKATLQSVLLDGKNLDDIQWPIEITSDNIMTFGAKRFRGDFIIYKKEEILTLVNKIDVEDYLKGVVPCELRTDELEALKAQAIASRSFALSSVRQDEDYDLTSTTADQVYNGVNAETRLSNKAIKETRGIVCTYNGKVIRAQYSSTCGGRTGDGKTPYLRSRRCQFCKASPHYEWECRYQKNKFFSQIGVQGNSIKTRRKDSSGRVEKVEFQSASGETELTGEELRAILGLKSRFFDIKNRGNEIIITGKGYGHGIGLCQYGAVEMAKRGFNYKSILKYYYSNIRIEKRY